MHGLRSVISVITYCSCKWLTEVWVNKLNIINYNLHIHEIAIVQLVLKASANMSCLFMILQLIGSRVSVTVIAWSWTLLRYYRPIGSSASVHVNLYRSEDEDLPNFDRWCNAMQCLYGVSYSFTQIRFLFAYSWHCYRPIGSRVYVVIICIFMILPPPDWLKGFANYDESGSYLVQSISGCQPLKRLRRMLTLQLSLADC